MTEQSKLKKLTRIDVIIVVFVCVFVCLLILGIVLPAFYHARLKSIRVKCARNLFDISKAMLIYANDYDGKFPRAGSRTAVWAVRIPQWMADNRFTAYNLWEDGSDGLGSITSSFYLLVKHTNVSPKSFVCPGEKGATEFKPVDYGAIDIELTNLWDFGPESTEHCSYSYHMPYGLYHHGPSSHIYHSQFPLTTSSEPGMAVAADRNPWIGSPTAAGKHPFLLGRFDPYGDRKLINIGNAIAHQEDGQNVLFMDSHVGFEKRPFCGIDDDNIYTYWNGGDIRIGGYPVPGFTIPLDRLDSLLVNDGEGPPVLPSPSPIR